MPSPRRALFIILPAVVLVTAACTADSSPSAGGGGDGEGTTVNVALQEFSVLPDVDSAPAGEITFHVTNEGPDDVHEIVIVKTDLAPGDLPVGDDGSVLEDGEGVQVIDEIEDMEVGDVEDLTVDLEAGSYVLLCNVVEEEDGETEAHYEQGMRTAFTVE